MIVPPLKYPGAKWTLAQWIIDHLPRHTHYIEPYLGSGAVFFSKMPSKHEVINDLDGRVVNFFRVCREHPEDLAALLALTPWSRRDYALSYQISDDPLEDARRFAVRSWQSHGFKTADRSGWRHNGVTSLQPITGRWSCLPDAVVHAARRLKDAEIECKPALDVIRYYNAPDVLIYADPPYVRSTRRRRLYRHEMTDADHVALIDTLRAHRGPVVLSGYTHPIYTERLADWRCVTTAARAEKGATRTEVIWINRAGLVSQPSLLAVEVSR